jgi:VanZ family protein
MWLQRGFLALVTFLVGFDLILVVLSVFFRLSEGSWLTLALTLAFVETIRLIPRLMTPVVRLLLGVTLLGGMVNFWFLSQAPTAQDTERFSSYLPPMAVALPVGAFLLWLGLREERQTVSPRTWSLSALIIACMWLVAFFSSSQGGAGGMLHLMVTSLGVPERFAETILVPLRKTIHFTFYGSVGLLAWTTAQTALSDIGISKSARRLAFGLLIALSLASFDEARQFTQPGRTGAVTDVMLDMSGALTFVGIAEFVQRKRERRIFKEIQPERGTE